MRSYPKTEPVSKRMTVRGGQLRLCPSPIHDYGEGEGRGWTVRVRVRVRVRVSVSLFANKGGFAPGV